MRSIALEEKPLSQEDVERIVARFSAIQRGASRPESGRAGQWLDRQPTRRQSTRLNPPVGGSRAYRRRNSLSRVAKIATGGRTMETTVEATVRAARRARPRTGDDATRVLAWAGKACRSSSMSSATARPLLSPPEPRF